MWDPEAGAAGEPQSTTDLLLQRILGKLIQETPAPAPDEEYEAAGAQQAGGGTRGTTAIQHVWSHLHRRPDLVITETLSELRRRLGLSPHEPLTVSQYARMEILPLVPTHRTLKKLLMITAHCFDQGYQSGVGRSHEGAQLLAMTLQCFKVSEAAARMGGT